MEQKKKNSKKPVKMQREALAFIETRVAAAAAGKTGEVTGSYIISQRT